MECPLCGETVVSEEDLQLHYVSSCSACNLEEDAGNEQSSKEIRFRWVKTRPTLEREMFLISSLSGSVPLRWNDTENCFESDLTDAPFGRHVCQLALNDDVIATEDFEVTQETDVVYIVLAEVTEEEIPEEITEPPVDEPAESTETPQEHFQEQPQEEIHATQSDDSGSLYKELLQHQLSHGEPDWVPPESQDVLPPDSTEGDPPFLTDDRPLDLEAPSPIAVHTEVRDEGVSSGYGIGAEHVQEEVFKDASVENLKDNGDLRTQEEEAEHSTSRSSGTRTPPVSSSTHFEFRSGSPSSIHSQPLVRSHSLEHSSPIGSTLSEPVDLASAGRSQSDKALSTLKSKTTTTTTNTTVTRRVIGNGETVEEITTTTTQLDPAERFGSQENFQVSPEGNLTSFGARPGSAGSRHSSKHDSPVISPVDTPRSSSWSSTQRQSPLLGGSQREFILSSEESPVISPREPPSGWSPLLDSDKSGGSLTRPEDLPLPDSSVTSSQHSSRHSSRPGSASSEAKAIPQSLLSSSKSRSQSEGNLYAGKKEGSVSSLHSEPYRRGSPSGLMETHADIIMPNSISPLLPHFSSEAAARGSELFDKQSPSSSVKSEPTWRRNETAYLTRSQSADIYTPDELVAREISVRSHESLPTFYPDTEPSLVRQTSGSRHSSGRQSPASVHSQSLEGERLTSSRHSSARQSPATVHSQPPLADAVSKHSSDRQSPVSVHSLPTEGEGLTGSRHSSARQSPASVHSQPDAGSRHSSARQSPASVHSQERHTPTKRDSPSYRHFATRQSPAAEQFIDAEGREDEGHKATVPPIKAALLPSHSSAFQMVNMKGGPSLAEYDILKQEKESLEVDMTIKTSAFQAQIKKLKRENEDLREQLLNMKVAVEPGFENSNRVRELERTVSILKQSVGERDGEAIKHMRELHDVQETNRILLEEQDSLRTISEMRLEDMRATNINLQDQLKKLKRESYERQRNTYTDTLKDEEISELRNLCKNLKDQVAQLTQTKMQLQSQLKRSRNEIETLKTEKLMQGDIVRGKKAFSPREYKSIYDRPGQPLRSNPDLFKKTSMELYCQPGGVYDSDSTITTTTSHYTWSDTTDELYKFASRAPIDYSKVHRYDTTRSRHPTVIPTLHNGDYSVGTFLKHSPKRHSSIDDESDLSDPPEAEHTTLTGTTAPRYRTFSSGSSTSSLISAAEQELESGNLDPLDDGVMMSCNRSKEWDVSPRTKKTQNKARPHSYHSGMNILTDIYGNDNLSLKPSARSPKTSPERATLSQSPKRYTETSPSSVSTTSHSPTSPRQNTRPFAPLSAAEVQVGMRVLVTRTRGKVGRGIVKYVGKLPGRTETYLGVELDSDGKIGLEDGKHDGVFEGHRYFRTKANRGIFVSFNKVVMVWG